MKKGDELKRRILNAMDHPEIDKRHLQKCIKAQDYVSKMKESQMLISGFEKKSFGVLPNDLTCLDIDFSYSLATYTELAQ